MKGGESEEKKLKLRNLHHKFMFIMFGSRQKLALFCMNMSSKVGGISKSGVRGGGGERTAD